MRARKESGFDVESLFFFSRLLLLAAASSLVANNEAKRDFAKRRERAIFTEFRGAFEKNILGKKTWLPDSGIASEIRWLVNASGRCAKHEFMSIGASLGPLSIA
ncbi:MAG: hypothetical protein ISN28_13920 [Ectothiorhodospiraceae bacterium AqS1]|nr:hypothetical protein [Ectothiorhodospiraceae bacterium AqS1]